MCADEEGGAVIDLNATNVLNIGILPRAVFNLITISTRRCTVLLKTRRERYENKEIKPIRRTRGFGSTSVNTNTEPKLAE